MDTKRILDEIGGKMKVQTISNQTNFNGQAYLTTKNASKSVKTAVKEINSLNAMKNANFDLYIQPFQRKVFLVEQNKYVAITPPRTAVFAAENEKATFYGDNYTYKETSRHTSSIVDAAKQVITEHTEKLTKKSILNKILNYFGS